MITLEIPRVPVSPNALLGMHWRHRHRNTKLWAVEVSIAVYQAGCRPKAPFPKARVSIERRSSAQLDPDNLVGCMKPVIDALRRTGILLDDSPDHLELTVRQVKSRTLHSRTLIEITPLEPVA